jgi:hypothetical protein
VMSPLKLNPYPPHYRTAFACSLLLYPPPPRLLLRAAFPTGCPGGEATGLPRSAAVWQTDLRRPSRNVGEAQCSCWCGLRRFRCRLQRSNVEACPLLGETKVSGPFSDVKRVLTRMALPPFLSIFWRRSRGRRAHIERGTRPCVVKSGVVVLLGAANASCSWHENLPWRIFSSH